MLKKCTLILLPVAVAVYAQGNRPADPAVAARAMAYFEANARAYGLSNPAEELKARTSRRDNQGATHVRFDQYYKGVKVFEGEAIAHGAADGSITVTDSLRRGITIDVTPRLAAPAAAAQAARLMGVRGSYDVALNELTVLPRGERSARDVLAYHIRLFVENDVDATAQWDLFLDAMSGAVVWAFDSLETSAAVGQGRTMYDGLVSVGTDWNGITFYLRDLLRAGNETRDMKKKQGGSGTLVDDPANDFGDYSKSNTDPDTAAADAHFGMAETWDYYQNTFGRNGIDGAGRKSYSRVHYGRNYQNAFWSDSCFCMTYGDGGTTFYPLVSIDVAGHEMSHGVMSTEADLTYSGESGGLNEANSDMFGTLVEFYAGNSLDVPDYWIGERIYRSNWSSGSYVQTKALRYMDDPAKDGRSPACWYAGIGSLDVHYSSGPANHMFYLLAHGGTSKCNGSPVTGIGNDKAARIWYDAVTGYMTSSTNYAGARAACLSAAAARYGAGSPEYAAVAAAFSAINVN